jgi:predicted metal-dependent hydrolase
MSIDAHYIEISGIVVEIIRKNIKNLHLAVYPPSGRVRLAVPLRINNEAARLAVASKLGWIKSRQAKFQSQERQSQRDYVSGESHYFMGRRYRLCVTETEGLACVKLHNKSYINLSIPKNYTREQREQLMYRWYRRELRAILPELIKKWERRMQLQVSDLRIKRMKTMWGSCNPAAKRIWLNLELAKKPEACLEYILVHEMAHFLERTHNDKFICILDKYMPQWCLLRKELNKAPLAHEDWGY